MSSAPLLSRDPLAKQGAPTDQITANHRWSALSECRQVVYAACIRNMGLFVARSQRPDIFAQWAEALAVRLAVKSCMFTAVPYNAGYKRAC